MRALLVAAIVLAFTACGGRSIPVTEMPDTQSVAAQPDAGIRIFTANRDGGSILAFSAKASGNVAPAVTIAGSKTTLTDPDSMALDAAGNIYAANDGGTTVAVFAANAHGNATPLATITGISYATGVVADAKDHIYVADFSGNSIKEFAKNANGNATPLRTIQGSNTTLSGANFLALY